MKHQQTEIWFDLTQALIYPAVLAAMLISVINLLSDTVAKVFEPKLARPEGLELHVLEAFGVTYPLGITIYSLITLFMVAHYSMDYLYSKYSEEYYGFTNFLFDLLIASLLAFGFITFSNNTSRELGNASPAFRALWICIALTYLIFLFWDIRAYRYFRNKDSKFAEFFHNNYRSLWSFDNLGIVVFSILTASTFFIKETNAASFIYVILGTVALGFLSAWYLRQVFDLEIKLKEHKRNG